MSAEIIELDDVDGLGAGAVGQPGQRAFYIQARTEHTQLTVLVEKEQVELLATEAVAFLDQIADKYPELPFDLPPTQSSLREPTVPLFRARLVGLGGGLGALCASVAKAGTWMKESGTHVESVAWRDTKCSCATRHPRA